MKTRTEMSKTEFVHTLLCPAIKRLFEDVVSVTYGNCGKEERVYVIFENGYEAVEVNAMSNSTLASAVISRLDELTAERAKLLNKEKESKSNGIKWT